MKKKAEFVPEAGGKVPLSVWAAAHGISAATARQRAGRGAFSTAAKFGSMWVIDRDEPLVDHRKKDSRRKEK